MDRIPLPPDIGPYLANVLNRIMDEISAGGGAGTVTTISVTTANGVSATVTNPTTTPALSFVLGAITPSSINGNTVPSASDIVALLAASQTFTNKRITARVQSVTDAATITPSADNDDCVDITAIAQAFTIANPTGTPTNFQRLTIRIKDNDTARAITFGSGYVAGGVSLPTTTVLSKILTLGFVYNTANSLNKWQLVASAQEA